MHSKQDKAAADPSEVVRMFDRIASTYDFLNRFFSLGIDRKWRRKAIRSLHLKSGESLLDCSAGTGDMTQTARREQPDLKVVLLDPAQTMLRIARSRVNDDNSQVRIVQSVAEALPFPDNTFDCFTIAFGIRNFSSLDRGMKELYRILKPSGRGVVLEFTPDRSKVINALFRFYMWGIMRPVGALISRKPGAYAYLARTVDLFQTTGQLRKLFEETGFLSREIRPLSFGISTMFLLDKPLRKK